MQWESPMQWEGPTPWNEHASWEGLCRCSKGPASWVPPCCCTKGPMSNVIITHYYARLLTKWSKSCNTGQRCSLSSSILFILIIDSEEVVGTYHQLRHVPMAKKIVFSSKVDLTPMKFPLPHQTTQLRKRHVMATRTNKH